MPIRDNDLLVYFGKYCKSCKHKKTGGERAALRRVPGASGQSEFS